MLILCYIILSCAYCCLTFRLLPLLPSQSLPLHAVSVALCLLPTWSSFRVWHLDFRSGNISGTSCTVRVNYTAAEEKILGARKASFKIATASFVGQACQEVALFAVVGLLSRLVCLCLLCCKPQEGYSCSECLDRCSSSSD
jgi:hypothetical protein